MATDGERRILGFLVALALIGAGARAVGVHRFERTTLGDAPAVQAAGAARALAAQRGGRFGTPESAREPIQEREIPEPRRWRCPTGRNECRRTGVRRETASAPWHAGPHWHTPFAVPDRCECGHGAGAGGLATRGAGPGQTHCRAKIAVRRLPVAGRPASRPWHRTSHSAPVRHPGDVFRPAQSHTQWGTTPSGYHTTYVFRRKSRHYGRSCCTAGESLHGPTRRSPRPRGVVVTRKPHQGTAGAVRISGTASRLTVVRLGMVPETEVVRMLARQYRMPAVDLARFEVDTRLLKLIPPNSPPSTRFCRSSATDVSSRSPLPIPRRWPWWTISSSSPAMTSSRCWRASTPCGRRSKTLRSERNPHAVPAAGHRSR